MDGEWAPVRWRDPDTGRVRGGSIFRRDGKIIGETKDAYTVTVPDWIAGTAEEVIVPKALAVLGHIPWPDDR
jgi:hypothetical protein